MENSSASLVASPRPTAGGGGSIAIRGLRKEFEGGSIAVDGIDLEIASGEFFSLLGPSGCGKTTTLRMLAGFEQPTNGQILIDGVDVAQTPPHKRPVNTVFQSYALFPHMDVWKNVEYGLRWAKLPKAPAKAEGRRRPRAGGNELSTPSAALTSCRVVSSSASPSPGPWFWSLGAAAGRAIGSLGRQVAPRLRAQLTDLQRRVGITFVFVTHDQEEALEMSDRLAVMNKGHIMQIGAPRDDLPVPQERVRRRLPGCCEPDRRRGHAPAAGSGRSSSANSLWTPRSRGVTSQAPGRAVIRPESVAPGGGRRNRRQPDPGNGRAGGLPRVNVPGVRATAPGSLMQSLVTNAAYEEPWASGDACRVRMPSDSLRVLEQSGDAAWSDDADDRVGCLATSSALRLAALATFPHWRGRPARIHPHRDVGSRNTR